MQKKWIAAIAGVVGIGIAVVMIPMPDTGGDVPDYVSPEVDVSDLEAAPPPADDAPLERAPVATDVAADPTGSVVDASAVPVARVGVKARPGARVSGQPIPGAINPVAEERADLLHSSPEGQAALTMAAPWAEIGRVASAAGDAELAEAASGLAESVRDWRRELDFEAFPELVATQRDMLRELRQSGKAQDPEYAASVDALAMTIREFETGPLPE